MKDWKYLIAYTAPLSTVWGISQGGWASFGLVYLAFGIIPLVEHFLPQSTHNEPAEAEEGREGNLFFDVMLYLHVPIMYGIIGYALYVFHNQALSSLETVGMVLNVGTMVGTFGINIGHELGHRHKRYEQFLAKALLLPALYQHFFIEHNRGHHKHVATDADPASARFGENLYAFWVRSVILSYKNAWLLEKEKLDREGQSFWSWHNEMMRFQVFQLIYVGLIAWQWGFSAALMAVGFALVGFLLLETVNYIEHYGLRRVKMANGRFEPVLPRHSWNSNHTLGRIFLYELTRHSDHHYKATRKYQNLRHFDESPQLPFGYPLSMLTSLVPPLWFRLMNNRVPRA